MERKIGIVVDSTTKSLFKEKMFQDASIVPLTINVSGTEYIDGSLTNFQIVDFIAKKQKVTTSQPSPESFKAAYEEQFALGYETVVCITISKGLSGTVNSANLAADELIKAGKDLVVIDSMTVGPGVEQILAVANDLINQGKSRDEVIAGIRKCADEITLLMSIEDLAVLVAGGRLSRLQALVGNILKVKPILMFKRGVLTVFKKVRGSGAILPFIAQQVKELYDANKQVNGNIAHVCDEERSNNLKAEILKIVPEATINISGPISPVVAVHIGYAGLGITFF